jgi:tetratricopeptide (TPR) repeat protein
MFKNIYEKIRERLDQINWIAGKPDEKMIEKSLRGLNNETSYTEYKNRLQSLERQVYHSVKLRQSFLKDRSKESFDKAIQASESSIIAYRKLRKVFSRSTSFLNNYGIRSAAHQFFTPEAKDYSKSISLFWNAIFINPFYHFSWFNLGVVYQLKGNLILQGYFILI